DYYCAIWHSSASGFF
nr:immunoglobulin light chain junction region [Macaca mulatta]MOW04017.1 immunoglobulin light chain junction region [Macaca mulatta]MOW04024.1 immunoglobulin light chain junction region [Macaca mulatta]MOW04049.1 immunoglobulin light chain junction region [Macaca mulatta]MOW04050.1 immunoglobulin light chain junction region [Macaca mulatta]